VEGDLEGVFVYIFVFCFEKRALMLLHLGGLCLVFMFIALQLLLGLFWPMKLQFVLLKFCSLWPRPWFSAPRHLSAFLSGLSRVQIRRVYGRTVILSSFYIKHFLLNHPTTL
jgi:hypothetical protein